MRILYFVNSIDNVGGIDRIVIDKANWFQANGHSVAIAQHSTGAPAFPLNPDIMVYSLQGGGKSLINNVKRIVKAFRPDVILNAQMRKVSWLLPFICRHIPKIVELHFSYEGLLMLNKQLYGGNVAKAWINNILRRTIYPLYDRCVVLSNDDVKAWGFKNIHLIPNFSNVCISQRSPLTAKKVISVGRYEDQKDFPALIDAWRIVADRHPDWVLDIYGHGSMEQQLRQQVSTLGIEGKVNICGRTDNVAEELCRSSLFALSSKYEGLALVLIEAQQCGLPTVSFDIKGAGDIIDEGKNGYLVSPRTPEALADAICKVISNDALRQEMAENAFESVKKFEKERVMRQWLELISDVTSKY